MALLSQHVFSPFNFRFRSTHTGCLIPPLMSLRFFFIESFPNSMLATFYSMPQFGYC